MAELSKQALKVQNNTEFPNNNAGLITPSKLRGFNVDMIDSLVDEISYQQDSASWNQQIDSLENFTASLATDFVTTGSFNSFTQSFNSFSASVTQSIVDLQNFSASLSGGFVTEGELQAATQSLINQINTKTDTSSFNAYTSQANNRLTNLEAATASINSSITQLNASSASQQVSIDALNVFTASQSTASIESSITNLNSATQSLFTSASLALVTASFNTGTRNLTFTKGDTTQFSVNIPDVSGSAGDFVTTSSFNTYTQSNDQKVDALINATGSYATLGANTFNGTQTLSNGAGDKSFKLDAGGLAVTYGQTATGNIDIAQQGVSLLTGNGAGQFNILATASFVAAPSIPNITSNLKVNGTFTSSLQQGYVWVGDAGGITTTVPTSSFGGGGSVPAGTISGSAQITALGFVSSSVTGSSLITASVAGADITFTKGDGSQFTITTATGSVASASFADTASLATNALDIIVDVKNTTGVQINKGTVVRIIGATGDNPLIGTASWEDDNNSANTLGFVVADIANDAFGRVMTQGTLLAVNTDPALGYAAGQLVYLSSSGQYTNVPPPAPYHEVRLGQVLRAQQNNGSIYVLIQNGYELGELHDVDINTGSLANNNLLAYDSASGQWTNKTLNQLGALTTSSFVKPSIESISGSVLITANTFTSGAASITHISGSSENLANILFKNSNTAGSTEVSGSNNLFVNPAVPTANFVRYIGGTGNVYLNTGGIPQITSSAASVSGNRPTMNNNILNGGTTWNINQAANPGTHTYSNNLLQVGTLNFNTAGNTGAVTFSNNIGLNPTITLNAPSRSIAQINAGASGSNTLSISANTVAGTINYFGPVSSSTHNITQNSIVGTFNLGLQSGSRAYTIAANNLNGTLTINDNIVFAPTLGATNTFQQNNINGTTTFNNRASSSFAVTNNNINTWTISSDADTSGITTASNRTLSLTSNILGGQLGNNILYSGSAAGSTTKAIIGNIMAGNLISASVGGSDQSLIGTAVLGHGLQVIGTSILNAGNVTLAGERGGSAFLGRWNALDGKRGFTAETVFAVGTGNSGSAGIVRKTGFLIDSGSNTFIEGTLNVSGASSLNGNLIITGSLTASLQQGYVWVGDANGITTTVATSSFGGGGSAFPFTGNAVITGSLGISGSMFGGVISLSVVSSTASVDFSAGNMFTLTLPSASTHINPTNIRAGQTVNIQITQPTPGTGSVTFPSNVKFAGGNDYQATTTGSAIDMLTLISYDGTNVLGTSIKNFL